MIREYAAFRERTQDMCPEEIKHAQARREQYVRLVTMSLSPERYPSGAYEKKGLRLKSLLIRSSGLNCFLFYLENKS